jgi:hypothetical protein
MAEILFAVESSESRSLPLNAQRLVNFFTEKQTQGAKSQTPLFGAPGMTPFSDMSTIIGAVSSLGLITGGSGYAQGVFANVPLTGGSGSGALGTITVVGGVVTSVAVAFAGSLYVVGDVLSASNANLGGTGSGFSVTVATADSTGIEALGSFRPVIIFDTPAANVPLTGGSGSGATGYVSFVGGDRSRGLNVTIIDRGVNYKVGDVLTGNLNDHWQIEATVTSLSGGGIVTLGSLIGGSAYNSTSSVYRNVPLTGGSGTGAIGNVTISTGAVTAVDVSFPGLNYAAGDVLSAANANLGGAGSGFSVPVATTNTTGPVRGSWVRSDPVTGTDIPYVIAGNSLYQIHTDGTNSLVGSGIGGTDLVGMSDNGYQLCIVSGEARAGWILDANPQAATFGFQQITSDAFYPANTVSFFDGYFVFDRIGTNQFFISSLYDGTTYSGLDFASAESQPDFVTGTIQNLQLLFIICQKHLELWYDAGAADFPFQRYTGSGISYGCVSPHSIIKQDGAIFFLGSDKIFYRLQSTTPIRISTHAIEHIIAQDPDITQAYCFTYTLEGHKFVVLQLPASSRTLVFDISTNRWHERESWDQNNVSIGKWRANTAFQVFNNIYLGDSLSSMVGMLDWTIYTELGNTMRGIAYSIPYHQDRKRLFVSRFELDVQAGVGLTTGQGSDPQVMLGWSVDGANTFKPLQPWRSMGKIGEYLRRLRWLRMGQGRQFVFVISITDPVPRVIISAHADISVGM